MLTDEQQAVITAVRDGYHVCVTALPGCGKTHVAMAVIDACTDPTVLVLMYNRSLNETTTQRLLQTCWTQPVNKRVRSYTFHGVMAAMTSETCYSDTHMDTLLDRLEQGHINTSDWVMSDFSLLIIDEAQDLRPSLFRLVRLLIARVCTRRHDLRVLLLGDPRQVLYHFYNHDRADSRFLRLGPELLAGVNTREWRQLALTHSFRITPPIAAFLNSLIPNHQMIPCNDRGHSSHEPKSRPVRILVCDVYMDTPSLLPPLLHGYADNEVLILANSTNARSPMRQAVQALIMTGHRVTVQRSGGLATEMETTTKSGNTTDTQHHHVGVQVQTFCAAKGLESRLVIVIHTGPLFTDHLPSSVYVALTRSHGELVILQQVSTVTFHMLTRFCADSSIRDHVQIWLHRNIAPPQQTQSLTTCSNPAPTVTDNVEVATMFTYISAQFLQELMHEYVLCQYDEKPVDESYQRLCLDGRDDLLLRTLVLAIEYQRRREIPSCCTILTTSTLPRVQQLHRRALDMLEWQVPHHIPWSKKQLIMKLPAFAMLALALDATAFYSDRLPIIQGFHTCVQPCVIQRMQTLWRLTQHWVPNTMTRFYTRQSRRIGNIRLHTRPMLVGEDCIVHVVSRRTVDIDTWLTVAMSAVVCRRTRAYVLNVYTNNIAEIYINTAQHEAFVNAVIQRKSIIAPNLPDEEFIHHYQMDISNDEPDVFL